jgi:hypothetical protein
LNRFVDAHGGTDRVVVVHRGTILELIRWVCLLCSDHPNDGDTFDNPQCRNLFVQALLMANDLWSQRVYGDSAFKGTSLDEKRTNALALIRHSMTETLSHARQFEAFARGKKLFGQIFPEYHIDFFSEFLQATGISLDGYYLCLCALMTHYMNSGAKSGVGSKRDSGVFSLKNITDPAPHMETLFSTFFELLSVTSEELSAFVWPKGQEEPTEFECKYSLKPLREHPILRTTDGRMIILDPACFTEKASVGPLFHMLNEDNQDSLFSHFGYAFETYVGSILQNIYPDPGSYLAKRLYADVREVRDPGIQIADFIIDDVSDMIIIEAKAVWMQDTKISQEDPNVFVEHIQAKYGGKERQSGYKQLARNINKILAKEWCPAGIDLSKTKQILPVLLVHDELLDAPVFGHFLAKEFSDALEPHRLDSSVWMIKGDFRVAPLIIMTVDELECLESSLNSFTLINLLKAYSIATPDRLISLNNFLAANSDQFPLIRNKNLATSWNEILQDCMRRVFPGKTIKQL